MEKFERISAVFLLSLVVILLFGKFKTGYVTGIPDNIVWDFKDDFNTLDTSKWSVYSYPANGVSAYGGILTVGDQSNSRATLINNPVQSLENTLWRFRLKARGSNINGYAGFVGIRSPTGKNYADLSIYPDKIVAGGCGGMYEAKTHSLDTKTFHTYDIVIGQLSDPAAYFVDGQNVFMAEICPQDATNAPGFYTPLGSVAAYSDHAFFLDYFYVYQESETSTTTTTTTLPTPPTTVPPSSTTTTLPSCVPEWSCTEWSACVENTKMRACQDKNSCSDDSEKPAEVQSCQLGSAFNQQQEDNPSYGSTDNAYGSESDCLDSCISKGFEVGSCFSSTDLNLLSGNEKCNNNAEINELCAGNPGFIESQSTDLQCSDSKSCYCLNLVCCDYGCASDGSCSLEKIEVPSPSQREGSDTYIPQDDYDSSINQRDFDSSCSGCSINNNCYIPGEKVLVEDTIFVCGASGELIPSQTQLIEDKKANKLNIIERLGVAIKTFFEVLFGGENEA